MMSNEPSFLKGPRGLRLAYRLRDGAGPGVVFLCGFRSDMNGNKAAALDDWAARMGRRYLRFDYSGHGRSDGNFRDGAIGDWLDDCLSILDALCEGPQILVGSSMGGWIALLAARARPERVKGLVLIAPAPDFTEDLIRPQLSDEARDAIERTGEWCVPSAYDPDPTPITRRLLEDGRHHLVLRDRLALDCPVRIFHGMQDPDVPWRHSLKLAEHLTGRDVVVTFAKDGDHRLSRPQDLARLERLLNEIAVY